jgi:hypothetical protein
LIERQAAIPRPYPRRPCRQAPEMMTWPHGAPRRRSVALASATSVTSQSREGAPRRHPHGRPRALRTRTSRVGAASPEWCCWLASWPLAPRSRGAAKLSPQTAVSTPTLVLFLPFWFDTSRFPLLALLPNRLQGPDVELVYQRPPKRYAHNVDYGCTRHRLHGLPTERLDRAEVGVQASMSGRGGPVLTRPPPGPSGPNRIDGAPGPVRPGPGDRNETAVPREQRADPARRQPCSTTARAIAASSEGT